MSHVQLSFGERLPAGVGLVALALLCGCASEPAPAKPAEATPAPTQQAAPCYPATTPAPYPEDVPATREPSGPEDFVGPEALPALYEAAADSFPEPLPECDRWPTSLPEGLSRPGRYEATLAGEVFASTYWRCGWEGEVLEAQEAGDTTRRDKALDMLGKWVTEPYFQILYEDPEQGWKRDVLDPARTGDVTEMRSQFSAGCRHYREFNPGPGEAGRTAQADIDDGYLAQVRMKDTVGRLQHVTDEKLLDAARTTCKSLAEGLSPDEIRASLTDPHRGAVFACHSLSPVLHAATQTYCPEVKAPL